MANAEVYFDELRFDVRDPDALHVYVFIRGEGDCPFMVHGWHHKAFPASTTAADVLKSFTFSEGGENPLLWENGAPSGMYIPPIHHPHTCLPIPVEQLHQWRDNFYGWDNVKGAELSDQISAHLTAVPDWHKTCPNCRSRDWLERKIEEQQG